LLLEGISLTGTQGSALGDLECAISFSRLARVRAIGSTTRFLLEFRFDRKNVHQNDRHQFVEVSVGGGYFSKENTFWGFSPTAISSDKGSV